MLRRTMVLFIALLMVFPAFAGAEEEALFRARDEQALWGYINAKGEWVIEPQFESAGDFENGYAPVRYTDNRREWDGWLALDGRLIKKVSGDAIPIRKDRFWERAWEEDYWYLTNEEGQVLSANYKLDDSFDAVSYRESDSRFCVQNKDDLWGYLDEDGQEVIPCQWDKADIFRNGLAYVEKEELSAYIDPEGNIVFSWLCE